MPNTLPQCKPFVGARSTLVTDPARSLHEPMPDLRALPAVNELASALEAPHALAVATARAIPTWSLAHESGWPARSGPR